MLRAQPPPPPLPARERGGEAGTGKRGGAGREEMLIISLAQPLESRIRELGSDSRIQPTTRPSTHPGC